MESRDEDLRSSDQCHRAENRRKSLGDKAIHNIYKKTSFPHMYICMPVYARTYKTPMEELRFLRDLILGSRAAIQGSPGSSPSRWLDAAVAAVLAFWRALLVNLDIISNFAQQRVLSPLRASCGVCVANRYFRAKNRLQIPVGTVAKSFRVCSFSPNRFKGMNCHED